MLVASKPGHQAPKLEKRTGDILNSLVDCSNLLQKNELIYGSISVKAPIALTVDATKPRMGTSVSFRVAGGPTGSAHVEYPVIFTVRTSFGNSIEVPIIVKVYSL